MQSLIKQQEDKWGVRIPVYNRVCRICHERFEYKRGRMVNNPDNWVCWDDQFWLEHWFNRNEARTVRINGAHYYISTGSQKGMGGQVIRIIFNDDRIVVTDNLWHQGTIPERWRKMGMEDNAKFGELINDNN